MAAKQVTFGSNPRPKPDPAALDAFVHGTPVAPPLATAEPPGATPLPPPVDPEPPTPKVPMKRLTFDIPADLHRRMKIACVQEDVDMAEVIRGLLAQRFP